MRGGAIGQDDYSEILVQDTSLVNIQKCMKPRVGPWSDCSGLFALGSAGKHYREEKSDYGSDYAAGNCNGIERRDASSGEQKAEIGYRRDPENCAQVVIHGGPLGGFCNIATNGSNDVMPKTPGYDNCLTYLGSEALSESPSLQSSGGKDTPQMFCGVASAIPQWNGWLGSTYTIMALARLPVR